MLPIFDTKDSSTKDKIISILSVYPNLNTKKINSILKKQYALDVTYQAVHKTLKQMIDQNVLKHDGKFYSISGDWISKLKSFVQRIENYESGGKTTMIDYDRILDLDSKETMSFLLENREAFDDFYFKIRKKLLRMMLNIPKKDRIFYHHIGNLYISLSHSTQEHNLIEYLKKVDGQGYYFCKGNGPVNLWATKLYDNSRIRVYMGEGNVSSRLVFLYPKIMIEVYYGNKSLEVFRRLYDRKWSIEQIEMSNLLKELYSANEKIQVIIHKDPFVIDSTRKSSLNLLKKIDPKEVPKVSSIEEIITERDIKDYKKLSKHLPQDYCTKTAKFILKKKGTILIATGFYIKGAGTVETDGLVGAVLLAKLLEKLDYKVKFITDKYCTPILSKLVKNKIIEVPIMDYEKSNNFAKQTIKNEKPCIIMSIERAGLTKDN